VKGGFQMKETPGPAVGPLPTRVDAFYCALTTTPENACDPKCATASPPNVSLMFDGETRSPPVTSTCTVDELPNGAVLPFPVIRGAPVTSRPGWTSRCPR
jgi:hypothetical protein